MNRNLFKAGFFLIVVLIVILSFNSYALNIKTEDKVAEDGSQEVVFDDKTEKFYYNSTKTEQEILENKKERMEEFHNYQEQYLEENKPELIEIDMEEIDMEDYDYKTLEIYNG